MQPRSGLRQSALLLFLSILLTACGGREISRGLAQSLIANLPDEVVNKDDVTIESLSQRGRSAIAQANVRTAFRFEKIGDKWVIREIRLGNDQWEKLDDLLDALKRVKTDETHRLLDQVVAALDRYVDKNQTLPPFKDYVSLTDELTPNYLTPLIRLDAWGHPFAAELIAPGTVRLASPGPDGRFGSNDDISLTKPFSR